MWFFRIKLRPMMHCSLNVLQYERFEEIFLIVLIKQLSVNVQRETFRCHIIAYRILIMWFLELNYDP